MKASTHWRFWTRCRLSRHVSTSAQSAEFEPTQNYSEFSNALFQSTQDKNRDIFLTPQQSHLPKKSDVFVKQSSRAFEQEPLCPDFLLPDLQAQGIISVVSGYFHYCTALQCLKFACLFTSFCECCLYLLVGFHAILCEKEVKILPAWNMSGLEDGEYCLRLVLHYLHKNTGSFDYRPVTCLRKRGHLWVYDKWTYHTIRYTNAVTDGCRKRVSHVLFLKLSVKFSHRRCVTAFLRNFYSYQNEKCRSSMWFALITCKNGGFPARYANKAFISKPMKHCPGNNEGFLQSLKVMDPVR